MADAQAQSGWVAPTGKGHWSKAAGRKMVEAWRQSGESRAEFARRYGLRAHRVKYWIDRVGGSDDRARPAGRRQRPRDVTFAPVRVVDSGPGVVSGSVPLEVVLGAAVVRVPPGFDEAHLRRLLAALGGAA